MKKDSYQYGSDETGLICGFLFRAGRPTAAINAREAADWLATDADGFIWLHFNLSNAASERWIAERVGVAEEFHDALHESTRSTRIEMASSSLIAVVNDVAHGFSFDPSDFSTLWMSVDARKAVSARRTSLQSVERLRQAVLAGEEFGSPVEILTHLLRDQADVLMNIVRDTVERVDKVEDGLLAGRLAQRRADLGLLRRVLVRLRRLLAPEPGSLFRLLQRPPAWIAETDTESLRQATEEFSVVLSDIASLQERIKLLQEEIAAYVNEENNRSLFLLTRVTVLALPINLVAGLFGMNVGGLPLADHPHGFVAAVGIVSVFTALAAWLLTRRRGDD